MNLVIASFGLFVVGTLITVAAVTWPKHSDVELTQNEIVGESVPDENDGGVCIADPRSPYAIIHADTWKSEFDQINQDCQDSLTSPSTGFEDKSDEFKCLMRTWPNPCVYIPKSFDTPPQCDTSMEYMKLIDKINAVCCIEPINCIQGYPASCTTTCFELLKEVDKACSTLLSGDLYKKQKDSLDQALTCFNDR